MASALDALSRGLGEPFECARASQDLLQDRTQPTYMTSIIGSASVHSAIAAEMISLPDEILLHIISCRLPTLPLPSKTNAESIS